jgi:16S rRNA (uracil1498-N3)-methyltransferase
MQRYFTIAKNNNYLTLETSDIHHIKNVMRNKVGDHIETVFNEKLYISEIESLNDRKVKIIEEKQDNNELNIDISVAIALVKEQKMDIILQKLTQKLLKIDLLIFVKLKVLQIMKVYVIF